jgi:hypothetical protein
MFFFVLVLIFDQLTILFEDNDSDALINKIT